MSKRIEYGNEIILAKLNKVRDISGNRTPITDLGTVSIAGFVDLRNQTKDKLRTLPLCLIDNEFPFQPYKFEDATDTTYYTYAPDMMVDARSTVPPTADLAVRWESRIIVPDAGTPYACNYGTSGIYNLRSAHIFDTPIPYDTAVFSEEVEHSLEENATKVETSGVALLPRISNL
jgi:hypothetical protein